MKVKFSLSKGVIKRNDFITKFIMWFWHTTFRDEDEFQISWRLDYEIINAHVISPHNMKCKSLSWPFAKNSSEKCFCVFFCFWHKFITS